MASQHLYWVKVLIVIYSMTYDLSKQSFYIKTDTVLVLAAVLKRPPYSGASRDSCAMGRGRCLAFQNLDGGCVAGEGLPETKVKTGVLINGPQV